MNALYLSDNLPILREMPSESVDLICTAPPIRSNDRNLQFKDLWKWDETAEAALDRLPQDVSAILTATQSESMRSYLSFLSLRLQEIHRILKPTGSLYLLSEPPQSHYISVILGSLFGDDCFRNEIIYEKNVGGMTLHHWLAVHDSILFYVKTPDVRKRIRGASDVLHYQQMKYDNPEDYIKTGIVRQQPEKLFGLIIRISSQAGDTVLDPFAGSGTTLVVSQQMGRHWIGIDIDEKAIEVIQARMKRRHDMCIEYQTEILP